MIKLEIEKINKYNYSLKDSKGNIHNTNIEFYNLEKEPSIKDCLYIDEKELKNIENQMVNYEPINKEKINNQNEIIVIKYQNGEKIYLNRIYG